MEDTIRYHRVLIFCSALLLGALLAKPTTQARASVTQSSAQKQPEAKLQLTSTSFEADNALPAKYTCDGYECFPGARVD